ncbi:MAG: amidohydrolase, partial [Gemmatimonadaceae bacterium]
MSPNTNRFRKFRTPASIALALITVTVAQPEVLSAQAPARQSADLVVLNGRIYTADGARPVVDAMAVRDGRIVFVGDEGGARALVGP